MTKTTDTPESASDPTPAVDPAPEAAAKAAPPVTYFVQRRLKKGAFRDEFLGFVHFWLDWHYFPLGHESYSTVFESKEAATTHIEEQKIEWPNFDYKIIARDS